MLPMTPVLTLKLISLLLWTYALVLAFAWFRAVGAEHRSTHVAHFVSLMGVFVPISSSFVMILLIAATLGLPSVVALLFVAVPAGIVVGLQLEVSRLRQSTERTEAMRLATTLALAAGAILWRGGL